MLRRVGSALFSAPVVTARPVTAAFAPHTPERALHFAAKPAIQRLAIPAGGGQGRMIRYSQNELRRLVRYAEKIRPENLPEFFGTPNLFIRASLYAMNTNDEDSSSADFKPKVYMHVFNKLSRIKLFNPANVSLLCGLENPINAYGVVKLTEAYAKYHPEKAQDFLNKMVRGYYQNYETIRQIFLTYMLPHRWETEFNHALTTKKDFILCLPSLAIIVPLLEKYKFLGSVEGYLSMGLADISQKQKTLEIMANVLATLDKIFIAAYPDLCIPRRELSKMNAILQTVLSDDSSALSLHDTLKSLKTISATTWREIQTLLEIQEVLLPSPNHYRMYQPAPIIADADSKEVVDSCRRAFSK